MPLTEQARKTTLLRQKERLASILNRLEAIDRRFVQARFVTFLTGAIALLVAFIGQTSPLLLAIPALFFALFAIVIFLHRRVDRSRARFRATDSLVSSQLARMDLDWAEIPPVIPIQVSPEHPFAADLSIVGERSIHQLMDLSTSRGGSIRLAQWLLEPVPDPDQIGYRHSVLRELVPLAGFRSRLALTGLHIQQEAKGPWDGERVLGALAGQVPSASLLPMLVVLTSLAAINILLFIFNLSGNLPPYWILSISLYGLLYLSRFNAYRGLFEDTYGMGKSLEQLRSVLTFLEKASYASTPQLARLCVPFTRGVIRPSRFLRKFVWITVFASLGSNPVLGGILNAILPWNYFFAYLLNGYKRDLSGPLREWLETWSELEALCSLANFAWLNPGYTFPRVLGPGEREIFSARGLGHPLIPASKRVCNDYAIDPMGLVAIITGSNMSGKSTFLRTVGVNLCLANAGAPVTAAGMDTRLFRLFTCIQVSDSLADGISYFYAEVRRLKQLLLEIEKPSPYQVFFLIDEIYRGTNNRERRIGSQAMIHTLSHSPGVGLVSTHDLDLVHLSDQESNVLNYHFREEIRDGRMNYDYQLRPGPSPTTNALKIMELEGLPINPNPPGA